MKLMAIAALAALASPAFSEQFKGVIVNPYTGYVSALIVVDKAKVQPHHLSECGSGCEFTDFLMPGQCMVVSISRRDAAYGYHFGPADDVENSRSQARHYCKKYGGTACKEYKPICN